MSDFLLSLKDQQQKMLALTRTLPNLSAVMDLQLLAFFPQLPADTCTDFIYISYESIPEQGQLPEIISISLTHVIEQCYESQQVPSYEQGRVHVYDYPYSVNEQDRTPFITIARLEEYLKHLTFNLDLALKQTLKDYWKTPLTELQELSAHTWLTQVSRHTLEAEMQLRYEEKTLSQEAKAAITHILAYPSAQLRAMQSPTTELSIYGLGLKGEIKALDIAFTGVFVIANTSSAALMNAMDNFDPAVEPAPTDSAQATRARNVVLYIPSSGIEEFDSLYDLSLELNARLKDPLQSKELLRYVLAKDQQRAQSLSQLGYRVITADIFEHTVNNMIDKQDLDITQARVQTRAEGNLYSLEHWAEAVGTVIETNITLSPASILQNRYTRLLESRLPQWLKVAPEEEKNQWRLAVERLRYEIKTSQAPGISHTYDSEYKSSLLDYAKIKIKQQVNTDHGIDINPDTITISTTEALSTGPVINPLSGSGFAAGVSIHKLGPTISYRTTTISLTELSLQNVGIWDITFALTAQVKDAAGNRHSILTPAYVKRLVRSLDIGESYKSHLNMMLVTSEQAKWRKERYVALKKAELTLYTLEAKMASHLSAEEAGWVKAVMDQPVQKDRPKVNGAVIVVHLLLFAYRSVPGLLVFTSEQSPQLLCYTPGAPDGIWFRRANTPSELCALLSAPSLHDYLLQRVTPAKQPYIRPLLKAGLSTRDVGFQAISHHYLEASYDTEALYAIRSADEQSTSTYESNVQTAKDAALTLVDIVCFILPLKIMLPLTIFRFMYSIGEGIDALKRDEQHEALLHFMGSIAHLTDGASDFVGAKVFGNIIRQRTKQPKIAPDPGAAVHRSTAGLTLRTGELFQGGVYELTEAGTGQSTYYLKGTQGNLYRSHYDNLNETWRLYDQRKPDARFSPPVREVSAGLWDISFSTAMSNRTLTMQELIERAQITSIDTSLLSPDSNGIYTVNNGKYIEQNGIPFEVQAGWAGRKWYLQVPSTSPSSTSTFQVQRNSIEGHWEIKRKHADGSTRWDALRLNASPSTSSQAATVYSNYDIAVEHRPQLRQLIARGPKALNPDWVMSGDTPYNAARSAFFKLRRKLKSDSQAFFTTHPSKPKVELPDIPANASHETVLQKLYEKTDGIVIGESHNESSGKKFLIENMPELSKNNIKTLYLEHLQTDLHQADLDHFFKTGEMTPQLEGFLSSQDAGHRVNTETPFTYSNLVREARKNGIEIKAIDCSCSYYLEGVPGQHLGTSRFEMMNYFASQVMSTHRSQTGGHKWIALTGNAHSNTFRGVPGIAELEGAVGLRIQDVAPGTGKGLQPDKGLILSDPMSAWDHSFLKNDLLLDIEIPGKKPTPPFPQASLDSKLNKPGIYSLENESPLGPIIVHRSRTGELVQTPFTFEPDGRFYIERPNWPQIHQKRYTEFNELIRDLRQYGMVRVRLDK